MELENISSDILEALHFIDSNGEKFKNFQAGVGPYGEPQLIKKIVDFLNDQKYYSPRAVTKRTPDLLIPGEWAIEFKITRPFGDNG